MVAEPFWLAAGVTVTVRLAQIGRASWRESGSRAVVAELPTTVRRGAAVPTTRTVKACAPVVLSSLMSWRDTWFMGGWTSDVFTAGLKVSELHFTSAGV